MKHPHIKESAIEQGIRTVLELDGWKVIKTDPHFRPGESLAPWYEPGTCDLICCRPIEFPPSGNNRECLCHNLFIETKAVGGRVSRMQRIWHNAMRNRGFKTIILGEDMPADAEEFRRWYTASGLCRRPLK